MKVVFKDLKHGEIKLIPENLDDIWHLYNIINDGDLVRGLTFRTEEGKDDKNPRCSKTDPCLGWDTTINLLNKMNLNLPNSRGL